MFDLPRHIVPKAPPIKTQGIKTKLVPELADALAWDGCGRWIEPFLGSGAVALNIAPAKAILADTNRHIIDLYRSIQCGDVDGARVRTHLAREGARLSDRGEDHYYYVRDRFNEAGDPLDFIFVSRSCFNGLMRFNRKGGYNVPFCRKPDRFRPALVTKIVNQVEWARAVISGKSWKFLCQDWRKTLREAREGDLVYCDPPYVGRHTDYHNSFGEDDSEDLVDSLVSLSADFAFSNWLENKYRRNSFIDDRFGAFPKREILHFYHVGSTEDLRNAMKEVIVFSPNVAAPPSRQPQRLGDEQTQLHMRWSSAATRNAGRDCLRGVH